MTTSSSKTSFLLSFSDWFWRSRAIATARQHRVVLSVLQRSALQRARASLQVATQLLVPNQRVVPDVADNELGDTVHVLLRRVLECLLEAMQSDTPPHSLDAAWEEHRARIVEYTDETAAKTLETTLLRVPSSGWDHASMQPQTLASAAVLSRVCDTLDPEVSAVPQLHRERWVRVLGLLGVCVLMVLAFPMLETMRRKDRAPTAVWTASSAIDGFAKTGQGFAPPRDGPFVFVHTQFENSPWVQFDLGSRVSVRLLRISNRMDCCQERAVPLLVELSDDGTQWREVARRNDSFYVWSPTFGPQDARYVRVRAVNQTNLHLERIEIR